MVLVEVAAGDGGGEERPPARQPTPERATLEHKEAAKRSARPEEASQSQQSLSRVVALCSLLLVSPSGGETHSSSSTHERTPGRATIKQEVAAK